MQLFSVYSISGCSARSYPRVDSVLAAALFLIAGPGILCLLTQGLHQNVPWHRRYACLAWFTQDVDPWEMPGCPSFGAHRLGGAYSLAACSLCSRHVVGLLFSLPVTGAFIHRHRHASAHRARVVFFGFVCHPEKHPQQACRGGRRRPGHRHLGPLGWALRPTPRSH